MSKVEEFYPSYDFQQHPFLEMALMFKIRRDIDLARKGDRTAESKLCNRIGSIRRSSKFEDLSPDTQTAVKEAVEYLRSTGRKVDFSNPDPSLWISTRDGRPRW